MMNEAVKSIMTTNLITVAPSTPLDQVRQIFMSHKIHHLPVVNDDRLVGLITTYDIWKNEIAPADYPTTVASEVMMTNPVKINPATKVGTAAELFLNNLFHALPVVDQSDTLVGIVTSFDVLLYQFKKEYPKPILFKELYEKSDRYIAVA